MAIPPEWAANHQQRKFGLAPIPLEAVQNPGWSAQRHRRGRRPEGRNYPRPKLDLMPSPSYCRLVETGSRRHPPTDRTAAGKPRSQIARPSAAPRGGRNFVAAPPATGPSPKKNLARRSLAARWVYFGRPRGFHLDCALAQRAKSLLRRAGDRCRSAREPGLPVATCIVRALAEIDKTTLGCLVNFLFQQSRAGASYPNERGLPCAGGGRRGRA